MESVVSAVASDLVSRFISILLSKISDEASSVNKARRLQQLLLRVQTVVSEAEGRYITNSGMLMQLKLFAETMHRGYHVLDKFSIHRQLKESARQQVSSSSSLTLARAVKRCRTMIGIASTTYEVKCISHNVQSALEDLEMVVTNMAEFVLLLEGCDRMWRKPYDAYLYMNNFMFGRHAEKQLVLKFLLEDNPSGAPAVLPIVGGHKVGKKTLVAHVCNNERVRSSFPSFLHLNGDSFTSIDSKMLKPESTLVVVEFHSTVNDDEWAKFYLSLTRMGTGSKVIIVSTFENVVRFGTVRPIHLNNLSDQEYNYLFKTLAFGSANPDDNPQLISIAQELATQLLGSLMGAYLVGDVLRKNIDRRFWLSILEKSRKMVQKNIDSFGEHPNAIFEKSHNVQLAIGADVAPLCLSVNVPKNMELPRVTLGDMLEDPTARPKGEFILVTWESRIPPYGKFLHYAPSCADQNHGTSFQGKKRRQLFL